MHTSLGGSPALSPPALTPALPLVASGGVAVLGGCQEGVLSLPHGFSLPIDDLA